MCGVSDGRFRYGAVLGSHRDIEELLTGNGDFEPTAKLWSAT
jgi:hypothetical protein